MFEKSFIILNIFYTQKYLFTQNFFKKIVTNFLFQCNFTLFSCSYIFKFRTRLVTYNQVVKDKETVRKM